MFIIIYYNYYISDNGSVCSEETSMDVHGCMWKLEQSGYEEINSLISYN